MELDVIIGLVTIWLTIVVAGLAAAARTRKLEEKIDGTSGKLRVEIKGLRDELRSEIGGVRDELRGEIGGVRGEIGGVRGEIENLRTELGGRIDAVGAELTRTRMAVARLEGSVFGIAPPDTGTDTA